METNLSLQMRICFLYLPQPHTPFSLLPSDTFVFRPPRSDNAASLVLSEMLVVDDDDDSEDDDECSFFLCRRRPISFCRFGCTCVRSASICRTFPIVCSFDNLRVKLFFCHLHRSSTLESSFFGLAISCTSFALPSFTLMVELRAISVRT